MSIAMPMRFAIDTSAPLVTRVQQTLFEEGDALANEIIAEFTDGSRKIDLTGYSAAAEMTRGDGKKVPCECAIAGNAVTVQLNAHCYAVPGSFTLKLRLTDEGTGVRRTILRISGRVEGEGDGAIVNIENYIPSIEDIIKEYDNLKAGVLEANRATVAADTAALGANAAAADANAAAEAAHKALEDTELIRTEAALAQEEMRLSITLAEQAQTENREATAAAQEAVAQTQGWASTTATAESIAPGSVPVVTMTEGETGRHLHFAIPRGDAPVRGEDYWTDADKAEIKAYVDDAILNGSW